ncbi:MAG: MFS transporter [Ignavibacteriae bacterium]|nr:MFS transporter [Ignavibacteriota bacterium]
MTLQLGLRPNIAQFSLLVLINAFVGAMVGMERSILPLIAEQDFGLASHSAILSFLISFGIVKAFSNLLAGRYSDKFGRKKLLVTGWIFGIPVPFMLMWAPSWTWVVLANVLLGVNQGLCWSTTVIMKSDLAGAKQRGLAMGLNEFSGYLAVALAAYFSALIAELYGLRPFPFYLGVGFSMMGFLLSVFLVKETQEFIKLESSFVTNTAHSSYQDQLTFKDVFSRTSWRDKNLFSCSQAGLVNNLNDGMAWGLFPLFFASIGFSLHNIGFLTAIYPATWGVTQLITGAVSDKVGRKWMIAGGMWLQAVGIWMIASVEDLSYQVIAGLLLGIGTAMVYPALLAAVGDAAHPSWRATAVGVYRLWRDLGYALGAVLSGVIADVLGLRSAIVVIGILTFLSGTGVAAQFKENKQL